MKKLILLSTFMICMEAYSQTIASGYYHALSICPDSTAQAWGNNSRGQLGNGDTFYSNIPVTVINMADIVKIDGGFWYSIALKKNGTVWTWGSNETGTLGNGPQANSSLAAQVTGVSNVKNIAAGAYHVLVLKNDKSVWAWGANNYGQLGTGVYTPSSVPLQIPGFDNVIAIAAGDDHSLALKSDGTVWSWGLNDQGELGTGSTNPSTSATPVQVTSLTDVVAVAGGGYKFSLALKSDGTVWAWGYNQWGQLGNGTYAQSSVPVQVSNLSGIISIAVHGGQGHAAALRNDGTVWTWGYNLFGQLGNGDYLNSNVPVQVSGLTDVVAISCGHGYSLARKSDGTVWGWGDNQHGQLGLGTFSGTYNTPVQLTSVCSFPTLINEIARENTFSIYPNPTSGKFRIEMNEFYPLKNSKMEIYNSVGALVTNNRIAGSTIDVDITSYPKGVYFIKITDGQQMQTKRIIIK